jgi:hypothetical protein
MCISPDLFCESGDKLSQRSWAELLDATANKPAMASSRENIINQARQIAERPIVRRVYKLEDIGKHRTGLDGRSKALEPEIAQTFALAMSDFFNCSIVSGELPVLSAAYRMTGEEIFRTRILEQLDEMTTWSPIQRPGWTCYFPGARLPKDGKDGNWLATGLGIRAIGDTIDLMPAGSIPPELRTKLDTLLSAEIVSIVDDWKTKRPWFVAGNNPITNQWVLPTEGLVRSCLILGVDKNKAAYELGVKNTLKALKAHGDAGEFEEGIGYASFTVSSLLNIAHAMAAAGDNRALEQPFLKNFPTWMVHHFQPGGRMINCFDSGGSGAPGSVAGQNTLACLFAICVNSQVARWALEHQIGKPSSDLAGLFTQGLPPLQDQTPPTLFAHYKRATRVNWRSSWDDDAVGVWVRGGHKTDQHDHTDRGHVNLIKGSKAILIEAGTPNYDNPRMMCDYDSGVGHNVLQIGLEVPKEVSLSDYIRLPGWQLPQTVAPIIVHKLDANGGSVSVNCTKCYDDLSLWKRDVTWDKTNLNVTDTVKLSPNTKNTILFRWHLGTEAEVSITGSGKTYEVKWPDATITLQADNDLQVTREKLPDHTMIAGETNHLHTCIVVNSTEQVDKLKLTTKVTTK